MTKKPKIARTRANGELHADMARMADAFVVHELEQCLMLYGNRDYLAVEHTQAALELRNQIYNALFKFHLKIDKLK